MLGVNTDASLRAVLGQIEADHKRPDLVLATGDLSQDGEVAPPTSAWPACCRPARRWRPHPLSARQPRRARHAAPRAARLERAGDRCGRVARHLPGHHRARLQRRTPADNQLDLLESALAEAPERPALVATHHNAMPITHWHDTMMIDNPQRLFQLLARCRRALLWGHVHHEFDRRRHNLRILATPSTCFQFSVRDGRHVVDGKAPGYRWIKLYRDGSLATGVVQEPAVNAAEAARRLKDADRPRRTSLVRSARGCESRAQKSGHRYTGAPQASVS